MQLLFLIFASAPLLSYAALGGSEESIATDQAALHAQHRLVATSILRADARAAANSDGSGGTNAAPTGADHGLKYGAAGGATDGTANVATRSATSFVVAIHELQLASGTIIREFVNERGIVFAVAWRGLELPDLRQILGESFSLLQQALQRQHTARSRHVAVNSPQLVAENHSTMRLRTGYALLPPMLPAGFKIADVQP